jgi:Fe-S cluster biogenesis protein NfuA
MAAPKDEIVRVINEVLGPLVHADGGELYLVSVDDAGVSLHLAGRFSGCPGNTLTRRRVLEPLITSAVPGAYLTLTTGPLIPPGAERVAAPSPKAPRPADDGTTRVD